MNELERELRETLVRIAGGALPSDALVERTVDRSVHILRRRRVAAASASAAVAVVAVVAVVAASIAGAGTRGRVEVTGPAVTEFPEASTATSASTTVALPITTTTFGVRPIGPGPVVTTIPTPGSTTAPRVTTLPPACATPALQDGTNRGSNTLLANGDIRVVYGYGYGNNPYVAFSQYTLDDGTPSTGGFTRLYTPAEFGTHWYDVWSTLGPNSAMCRQRHNFVVDPTTATPDPTPTSTSVPGNSVPESTTLPAPTTTVR